MPQCGPHCCRKTIPFLHCLKRQRVHLILPGRLHLYASSPDHGRSPAERAVVDRAVRGTPGGGRPAARAAQHSTVRFPLPRSDGSKCVDWMLTNRVIAFSCVQRVL